MDNWIQDTFEKIDLMLDIARSTYISGCGINEDNIIDIALDIYKRSVRKMEKEFRVIVCFEDLRDKSVKYFRRSCKIRKNGF